MPRRQRADARPPVSQRPERLIWSVRRRVQNDRARSLWSQGFVRQRKDAMAADQMPPRPRDHRHATFDRRPAQIDGKRPLLPARNRQAFIRQSGAKGRWITVQRRVGDNPQMMTIVLVEKAQMLAPTPALWITTRAENFERRGNPYRFGLGVLAPPLRLLREPVRVHRKRAPRDERRPGVYRACGSNRRPRVRRFTSPQSPTASAASHPLPGSRLPPSGPMLASATASIIETSQPNP